MSVLQRNNVAVRGSGEKAMVFAHGFGCDQNMWRLVYPAFEDEYKIVLFDHVGAGQSDLSAYDHEKYADLNGYANDVVEIIRELELNDVIFVGHSVSAMIGALASIKAPELFESIVMVGRRPVTSTKGTTRAASRNRRSRSFWIFSMTTIWAGRPPWARQSWAIRIARNCRMNS